MIIFVWVTCLFFFLIRGWSFRSHGRILNRRRVEGYEMARYVLDASGSDAVSIESVRPGQTDRNRFSVKTLFLPEAVYDGKSLYEVAEAGRLAHDLMRVPHALFLFGPLGRVWQLFQWLIPWAWTAILFGLFFPSFPIIVNVTTVFFVAVFVLGILHVIAQWEASEQLFSLFEKSQYFEVDELARLKKILRGVTLSPLAVIYSVPWEALVSFAVKLKPGRAKRPARRP